MSYLEKLPNIIKELEDKESKSMGGVIDYGQQAYAPDEYKYKLVSNYDNVLKSQYLGTVVNEDEAKYIQALYNTVPELLTICKELHKEVMQSRECMFHHCHFKPDDWMFRDGFCIGENDIVIEGKTYECRKCKLFKGDTL